MPFRQRAYVGEGGKIPGQAYGTRERGGIRINDPDRGKGGVLVWRSREMPRHDE